MREILFRGKAEYDGEWVYGYLIHFEDYCCIFRFENYEFAYTDEGGTIDGGATPVIAETVGQYTGLKDKFGLTNIFECDIIDTTGRKVGNYYENKELLEDGAYILIERMGTKKWSRSEQEAIKRGCVYAE